MGNSKSKKMKISGDVPTNDEDSGTIHSLKTDISDAVPVHKKEESEQKEKEMDNASSASTVEVLDDNK
jgi:hypothetical protein